MKRILMRKLSVLLLALLVQSVSASVIKKERIKTVVIFAAQSLKPALEQVADKFRDKNRGINIALTYDGSGNLLRMMNNGAKCDVFISADEKTMNEWRQKDCSTVVNLLTNRLVVVSADENRADLNEIEELLSDLKDGKFLFAMGNESVPAGNYMRSVFEYYGFSEDSIRENITYLPNASAVAALIREKAADFGAVYATDAARYRLNTVYTAGDMETGGRIVYPAAISENCRNRTEAQKFLDYLQSEEACEIFEKFGFTHG